jgi:hypothetical protein
MSSALSESVVEGAALERLESAGWQIRNGAKIAPGELRLNDPERLIEVTA